MKMNFKYCGVVLSALLAGGSVFAARPAAKPMRTVKATGVVTNQWGEYEPPTSLRRPYIAMNYTPQIVAPGEKVRIPVFVTDHDNTLARFEKDTFRFSVVVRIRPRGEFSGKEKVLKPTKLQRVKAGDYETVLPAFTEGEWLVGVQCVDNFGRKSHVVWHEILCRDPNAHAATVTKATKKVMLAEIEAKGGVAESEGIYRIVPVKVEVDGLAAAEREQRWKDEVAAFAAKASEPQAGGYDVYVPADENGDIVFRACAFRSVRTSPGRDEAKVEGQAVRTTEALQAVIDEAAAKGVRRLVMPKAVFRVSHQKRLNIPTRMTLDLNGGKLKLNGFAGSGGMMVEIKNADDAHLVNGTLEGDYFEHDYANSQNNSEWVMGACISGACRYSTIENVRFLNITGYGAGNGIDGPVKECVFSAEGGGAKWEPGVIDLKTGELVAGEPSQFTSRFFAIDKFAAYGYITFSRYLGYQGRATRAWTYQVAFYGAGEGAEKIYLGGETAFQYRHVPLPTGAKFARVTVEALDQKDAEGGKMFGALFKTPFNCAFVSNTFERCRCVGLAASAMLNMNFEGNIFTRSGESAAKCAFDAEDGWNMMQDVRMKGNRFVGNALNDIVICAGHDFLFEENEGDILLYERVQSPCVRNNRFRNATFGVGAHDRTMHGRYVGNTFSRKLDFGVGSTAEFCKGWSIVMSGIDFGPSPEGGARLQYRGGVGGLLRDSRLTDLDAPFGTFARCRLEKVKFGYACWKGWFTECELNNCLFQHFTENDTRFRRCKFQDTTLAFAHGADLCFDRCQFVDSGLAAFGFEPPVMNRIRFTGCAVENNSRPLVSTPIHLIERLDFDNCQFMGTNGVVKIDGLGASTNDTVTARIRFNGVKQLTDKALPLVTAPERGASTKKLEIEVVKTKLAPGVEIIPAKQLNPDQPPASRSWTVKMQK